MTSSITFARGPVNKAIDFARRRPEAALWILLAAHLVLWTLLPILVCSNLQLDLAEDLALGKEWQLGYWKHPPLPWWTADALYRLTGDVRAVYVLGPLSAAVCMYAVWLLARALVGPLQALIAVLALEGIHYYNYSVVKFAHDQMQLPFWAFTGLFFYRALARGRAADWLLAGACLALAFWSKYAAFALAATLGLFLLIDPAARRSWRTVGPYLMALAFALVIAPNAWWLIDTGFLPFKYVDARAVTATHWYHYLLFPLRWTASQLLYLLPAIGLLALLYVPRAKPQPSQQPDAEFNRRFVTALALGPFAMTTIVALILGRLPVSLWGYPLWSFAPLAAVMWLGPVSDSARLRRFAHGILVVLLIFPLAYALVELFESAVRDRPKATDFPGRRLAETVTQTWRQKYGTPLVYVAGSEFAVNNVAVYSPDRPHVVVHARPHLSPWVDRADLRRRGAVILVEGEPSPAHLGQLRAVFPALEVQEPLVLSRQTLFPIRPARIFFALAPPQP
jgi:4-amino-4-deoxy-L-arabinose transferase-like glycosyltransferase